ncbi:MAG: hypothetical protein MMC33_007877 [Icmadophila ericetorum]|nr:hypothetical protein [Icmadophila ericetorum]
MSASTRGHVPRSTASSPSSASASASASSISRTQGEDSSSNSREVPLSAAADGIRSLSGSESRYLDDRGKEYNTADGTQEVGHRRRGARSSGGFLIDSTGFKRRDHGNQRPTASDGGPDGNRTSGKRRVDEGNDSLLKGRAHGRLPSHLSKRSIGSSPLATEVTHISSRRENGLSSSTAMAIVDGSTEDTAAANGSENTSTQPESTTPSRQAPSQSSTFDTNPAQIVSLALSLGESRRRQFSINRLSPGDPLGGRRIASSDQAGSRYLTSPVIGSAGGSLKQHLQQQRRSSRNISPRSPAMDSSRSPRSQEQTQVMPQLGPPFTYDLVNDFNFNPSDATLTRADRAKVHLELLYEYRRLLQYLPKLPVPSTSRPSTAKVKGKRPLEEHEPLGRLYNPLQYIRNRKVRVRERKTFDAEADGWKDLTRVKNWVDSVASDRAVNVSRVDDKYPLPPFSSEKPPIPIDGPSPSSSIRNSRASTAPKPIRQGGGWNTTPWDLLADASWLDQGDNKRLIEDRDGNKLYPVKRPVNDSLSRLNRDVVTPNKRRSESLTRPSRSPEKMASPAPETHDSLPEKRGRARHKFRDSISSLQEYGSSPDRKNRWKLIRSRSSSSSNESATGSLHRTGRLDVMESRERQGSALLEKQLMDRLAKEAENLTRDSPDEKSGLDSDIEGLPRNQLNGNGIANGGGIKSRLGSHDKATSPSPRVTIEEPEEERGHKPRTSFEEFDSTAPSSPVSLEFVPSIAINLSPPQKRPSSLKPLAHSSRSRDGRIKENYSISATDFADTSHLSRNSTVEADDEDNFVDALPQPETPGFLSPRAAESFGKKLQHRRSDSASSRKQRDFDEPESRLKGLFKGNRFTEMVGNEVSKVGDIFRRRDINHNDPYAPSPASSATSDVSDAEVEPSSPTPRKRHRWSRNKNELEENHSLHRQTTSDTTSNTSTVKYHRTDLPTFISPFRDGETTSNLPDDHITAQQKERRRGRSPRFGHLAPPALNMRGISPSPSPPLSRVTTYETNDDSRRNSTNPSDAEGFRFPNQLKHTRKIDPFNNFRGPPPTGLSDLDSRRRRSSPNKQPGPNGNLQLSFPSRPTAQIGGKVTLKDIGYVRAKLLSSGIMANEILRRAQEVRSPPSQFFLDLQTHFPTPLPRVPRMQEHVLGARLVNRTITDDLEAIRTAKDNFLDNVDPAIRADLAELETHISEDLAPRVRTLNTDADTLLNDLIITHRLDIKDLDDTIGAILRRKRRRFRGLWHVGWVLVDWGVNGLMWFIWLVVTFLMVARGVVRGVCGLIRWLFRVWD